MSVGKFKRCLGRPAFDFIILSHHPVALNYIWLAFFIVAFVVAVFKTVFYGDMQIWSSIMSASFTSAATAFEISLGLTGILSLWLGLMRRQGSSIFSAA